jgi:hypothetical protein
MVLHPRILLGGKDKGKRRIAISVTGATFTTLPTPTPLRVDIIGGGGKWTCVNPPKVISDTRLHVEIVSNGKAISKGDTDNITITVTNTGSSDVIAVGDGDVSSDDDPKA